MDATGEIGLLIKSRYPLLYLESADEDYSLAQLKEIAAAQGMIYFQWSLTGGLRRGENSNAYYQSQEPGLVLKTIQDLVRAQPWEPALFVLKDFGGHLNDPVILRLCKDLLKQVTSSRDTLVILSNQYNLPRDLEASVAHIVGGYPDEREIMNLLRETIMELPRWHDGVIVNLNDREMEKVVRAVRGLTLQQIKNVLNRAALENNRLCIDDLAAIESYKRKIYDQEGFLEFYASDVEEQLAGFSNLKLWLRERKDSFNASGDSALPPPKGVLLMGVQGCGKSLAARVIARELNLPLYGLDLGKLYGSYIGQTEQNLRRALATVGKLSPLCLWIDEIEKGLAFSHSKSDGGVSKRVLGSFLTWMQERKDRCFLAATANDVQALPPELLRKGRLDEIFFVDLPSREVRQELFKIHLEKRGLAPGEYDCSLLAEESNGFSGAEIEQAVIAALYRARSEREDTGTLHILEQIRATRPLSVLRREEIAALREWAKDRTVPV